MPAGSFITCVSGVQIGAGACRLRLMLTELWEHPDRANISQYRIMCSINHGLYSRDITKDFQIL